MYYLPMTGQKRRAATAREVKALGHPLRLRILRLCKEHELTNKQLADRLGRDPGTVLHHVRQLTEAGLLEQAPVRTGASGALEKPYRSATQTWWLDGPLLEAETADERSAPVVAFQEELREAGPESVRLYERFTLHLSDDDIAELDRRILEVLDEYVANDDQRAGKPVLSGIFLLHSLSGPQPPSPSGTP
ncbi:Helix-turn-helix domain protein [Amycolatopsis sp. YIM 10]|nr:Helix-turn-helix domain protein [Amycolatopsis sp. YIM 10]